MAVTSNKLGQFTDTSLVLDKTVTILNGQTESEAIDLYGTSLLGFFIPALWTNTNIFFRVSVDGSNYFDLYDEDDNRVEVTTSGGSRAYKIEPVKLAAFNNIKLVATVAQAGDRVISLALRRY